MGILGEDVVPLRRQPGRFRGCSVPVVEIVDADENGEQRLGGYPFGIELPAAGIVRCEGGADLAEHARNRGTGPGKVVGFHDGVVVLRGHVHDEVGPVAGGVAFVGVGVAERVIGARLCTVFPIEAGGGIGCAAGREISICEGTSGWEGCFSQGKHRIHFRKALPVAVAGTEHGCVVRLGAGAMLKGKEDRQGETGNECIVHGKDGLVLEDRSGQAEDAKSRM